MFPLLQQNHSAAPSNSPQPSLQTPPFHLHSPPTPSRITFPVISNITTTLLDSAIHQPPRHRNHRLQLTSHQQSPPFIRLPPPSPTFTSPSLPPTRHCAHLLLLSISPRRSTTSHDHSVSTRFNLLPTPPFSLHRTTVAPPPITRISTTAVAIISTRHFFKHNQYSVFSSPPQPPSARHPQQHTSVLPFLSSVLRPPINPPLRRSPRHHLPPSRNNTLSQLPPTSVLPFSRSPSPQPIHLHSPPTTLPSAFTVLPPTFHPPPAFCSSSLVISPFLSFFSFRRDHRTFNYPSPAPSPSAPSSIPSFHHSPPLRNKTTAIHLVFLSPPPLRHHSSSPAAITTTPPTSSLSLHSPFTSRSPQSPSLHLPQ